MDFHYAEKIPVRFRDLDALGHVNNAVYITYLEIARIGYYRQITGQTDPTVGLIIARVECDYRSPALLGETVIVECATTDIGNSSMTMVYRLTDEASGRLIAEGKSVQVAYDYKENRPVPVPDELRQAIGRLEQREFPAPAR